MKSLFNRNGFTLIESLISLWIVLICMLLIQYSVSVMSKLELSNEKAQDDMAMYEIRLMLSLSKDIKASYNYLDFTYKNNSFSFYLYDDKLILTPGYQVYLQAIDSLYFITKAGVIYIVYERGDTTVTRYICEE